MRTPSFPVAAADGVASVIGPRTGPYVRSREELLTLLLVDGYNDLGDAVDRAIAAVDGADPLERFLALGRATRTWSLAEPARYALLYGTPVPGYDAPGDQTTEPGTRVVVVLARLVEDGWQAGELHLDAEPVPSVLTDDLERIRTEYALFEVHLRHLARLLGLPAPR